MIKKTLLPLFITAILAGCGSNQKAQEKTLLDSVIAAHDKVMGDDDAIMKAKANLKSLLAKKPALKDSVSVLLKKLDDNDNMMMDWMQKFNPDFTGKTHEQIMIYLNTQEKSVIQLDSQLKQGINIAGDFLKRNK